MGQTILGKESCSRHMFQDDDWYGKMCKEGHLSWRYAASELQKRAERAAARACLDRHIHVAS